MIDLTFKNANILVVDDKEANIDILTGLLDMQGYTNIRSTTDPRLVVGLVKSFNPDLILLDLMMPHLSGYEVMDQLKASVPSDTYLPILVLTADIAVDAKQRALAGGARDFLAKPFDLIEVGLRIKNLLYARFLHQQVKNQNQILEEKVKERTLELANTNIELIAALDKATESDRLKAAFLHNISHEIRTPSNGIIGFLELLQDHDLTNIEKEEYLGMFNQSAYRLINTVNDIVEISQITAGLIKLTISETNIISLIKELFERFVHNAGDKGLKFRTSDNMPVNLENVYTDVKKLNSILSNLIGNAIKFTKEGSIEFGFRIINDFLEFSVKDTGIGIPESKHQTIFDRFTQVDVSDTRHFEGAGIGLSIAKFHVEMLGGKIWLESELEKGSVFYFTIPYKTKM